MESDSGVISRWFTSPSVIPPTGMKQRRWLMGWMMGTIQVDTLVALLLEAGLRFCCLMMKLQQLMLTEMLLVHIQNSLN